ncbi:MAG: hypothetical protein KJ737_19855 [Proteobacteria bacterium]|nr:hypothetical protein [Pseudomonadota bacterium]
MKKINIPLISNESGSAIIIAVLVLAALTILGLSATNTSTIEVLLANNDMFYKENVYKAEGVAMEGGQALEDALPVDLLAFTPEWLNQNTTNMLSLSSWDYDNANNDDTAEGGILPNTRYAVVFNKIALGSSLDLSASTLLREFSIYGYSRPGNSSAFIEIGYKRRY